MPGTRTYNACLGCAPSALDPKQKDEFRQSGHPSACKRTLAVGEAFALHEATLRNTRRTLSSR
jgi:hypothetical protein